MLVSYCPRKGKVVTLLSAMHNKQEIQVDDKAKPLMILDYYSTKTGVDTMDQIVHAYTAKRKTRRWPMALIYNMLHFIPLNAYVIWLHIHPDWKAKVPHKRRLFLM